MASLLKKSNKTISAQKNSAMRRLAIHSNAEMYAWINSAQGAENLTCLLFMLEMRRMEHSRIKKRNVALI